MRYFKEKTVISIASFIEYLMYRNDVGGGGGVFFSYWNFILKENGHKTNAKWTTQKEIKYGFDIYGIEYE